jgi:hypothetical protein
MKTLSLTFGIIGILFQLLGIYILFTNYTQLLFFSCFGAGMISTSLFLITQNMLDTNESK